MKKIFLIASCVCAFTAGAQPTAEKNWVFGIHGGFNQYRGELGNGWYATNQAAYSFGGISVSRFLTRHWDLTFFGSRGDLGHQTPWTEGAIPQKDDFLVRKTTTSLWARYYILGHEPIFQPFVFAGGSLIFQPGRGDNFYPGQKRFDYGLPEGGVGFNLRLTRFMRLQLQEIFTYTSADYIDHYQGGIKDMYLMHCVGLIFNFPNFSVNKSADKPDLVVDKCPPIPRELQAKRAAKKRAKTKAKLEKRND